MGAATGGGAAGERARQPAAPEEYAVGALAAEGDVARLRERVAELEAELRAERERFDSIIARNADGVILLNREGEIRFANPAAEAIFGRSREELVGSPFGFPVVVGETTELDVVRRGGEPLSVEVRVVETRWRGAEATLVSLRDITDRRRAEERERELFREQAARAAAENERERVERLAAENARLYQQAQAASRAKSDFLAVMSHELRTPLNAIIGYLDLLDAGIAGEPNERQRHYLERISTSSHHLLQLVDEVLTFSRIDAGVETVRPEPVELGELLADVAALAEPLAVRQELAFRLVAPEVAPEWETDPAKVRQILLNLLSNAVKFTDEGEVWLEATIETGGAAGGEGWVKFTVGDTGIGIAPEHQETIFDAFWQVAQSSTRTRGGVGLGLAVTRRLAEMLGGTVSVESEPGAGSRFHVRLPLRPPSGDPTTG